MDEMDRLAIDPGAEVRQLVEPRLLRAPVVLVAPVRHQPAQVVDRHAVLPAGAVDLVREAGARQSALQVREDRVVLYGWVGSGAQRFVYRIKPTNRGTFRVPPVLVEGFYDRTAWGSGVGGTMTVGD